jgi:hypothetical protein
MPFSRWLLVRRLCKMEEILSLPYAKFPTRWRGHNFSVVDMEHAE